VTAPSPVDSLLGFETFGTAVGLALVVGALSLVAPPLTVLAGTLAALAIAGWASLRYREHLPPRWAGSSARWAAVAAASAGALVYLDPPGVMAPFRGLVLGVGLVPLWVAERTIARRAPAAGSTP
jgi:hypothetical protein